MWENTNQVGFIKYPDENVDVSELLRLSSQSEAEIISQFAAQEIDNNNQIFLISQDQEIATPEAVEKITGMPRNKPLAIPPDNDPLLSPNTENTNNFVPRYVTVGNPHSDRYIIEPGEKVNGIGLDGVVSLEDAFFGDRFCTGTLLNSGKHILTAGHCLTDEQPRNVQVTFNLPSGDVTLNASKFYIHPDYDSFTQANDIAIIELASDAPTESQQYEIYRDQDEIGQVHLKVGYGNTGQGREQGKFSDVRKRAGFNIYDDFANEFDEVFFDDLASIPNDTQLAYDFDNGKAANDAFGKFFGIQDTGLGDAEVNSAPGDSGGPTFIDGKIAGITSYGFGGDTGVTTDTDTQTNSSFGEFSVDTRISAYADWIDSIVGTSASGDAVDADFNNDGNTDILWRNSLNGKNQLWLMDDTKRTEIVNLPNRRGKNWQIVGTGDFNDDENIDILWRNSLNGKNQLWLMDDTERTEIVNLPNRGGKNWQIVGTGDFNDDENIDILWRNSLNGKNQLWLMDDTERVKTVNLPNRGGKNWQIVGTGDFNDDENIDIVWRNSLNGKNQLWLMDDTERTEIVNLPNRRGKNWQIVGTGNFNDDENIDIVWRNSLNGKNQLWLMDDTERVETVNLPGRYNTDWVAIV